MNLAQLQRAFQRHVLQGDLEIAAQIQETAAVPVATRLAVYADAYRLRLVDALAHNYPRLQQLLGAQGFAEMARGYLDAHPSTHTSVRWFGDQLAQHLQVTQPQLPVLCEMAQWEWTIAAAFDARDAATLTAADLSAIDPEDWASLQLRLQPSVQTLQLTTNAPLIYKALVADRDPEAPAQLPAPQQWLIWRQDLSPHYRSVDADEAASILTLTSGGTFADMCESLCDWHDAAAVPQRAVTLLHGWIRDEMMARVSD